MPTLNPPSPAWRVGPGAALSTTLPRHLARRGYRPTRPVGAEVFGVFGVPSDATVPSGYTIAVDTSVTPPRLYRRLSDGWYPVNGDGETGSVITAVYPLPDLPPSPNLFPGG